VVFGEIDAAEGHSCSLLVSGLTLSRAFPAFCC
jgi:hypothetical protein